jgi:CRP-like cAMP-binding protein
MPHVPDEAIQASTIFGRLAPDDRRRVATVASVRSFEKGAVLFGEGDPSDVLYTVITGRVKIVKLTERGTDVILEILGPGDPVGAVAVYEARPYPATALALEATTCLLVGRQAFFALLEAHPTLVRGMLVGLTQRLMELTGRLTALSGGRIEGRLARVLLKLAADVGELRADGLFIPMALSRQELADMIGTTIETSIRVMSRWGKQNIVRTDKNGFTLLDRRALEELSVN